MRILITGAAGFLGRKLATDLARRPMLMDADGGQRQVSELILVDQVEVPELPELGPDAPQFTRVTGDLDKAAEILSQPDPGIDGVVHLAAVVSAGAEADFELGYRVNLDGTRGLLEACRRQSRPPRFLFASSVAVFGGRMPDVIRDDTAATPQTSYGTQKLMGELLVADYSRKGMVDGRSLRLPTIVVRPGKPNRAASTFASSIVREPLQGQPATLSGLDRCRPVGAVAAGGDSGVSPCLGTDGRPFARRSRHQPAGTYRERDRHGGRGAPVRWR